MIDMTSITRKQQEKLYTQLELENKQTNKQKKSPSVKERKCILYEIRSFKNLYPVRDNKQRELCYPHTLSPWTYRTCSSSSVMTHSYFQSHSPCLISKCRERLLELAGRDHNDRTSARSGQLTILQPNKIMQCLARWTKVGFNGHAS